MPEDEDAAQPTKLNRARLVAALLEAGGVLIAAFALIWAIHEFWVLSRAADPTVGRVLETLVLMFAGVAGGALLWGVAEMVRKLDSLPESVEPLAGSSHGALDASAHGLPGIDTAVAPGASSLALEELVALMREVRDISLLNEQERAKRIDAQGRDLARRLQEDVPVLLREHGWVEARRRVEDARERFPSLAAWDELERQIEQVRAQLEARDIETASRQVEDLSALGAWDRALDLVRDLLERHPRSEKALELAKRVRSERGKVEAERRAKLMAHAQEAVNLRDWSAALSSANALVQRYANSPEAEALRLQMPTLRANSEIQNRQRMEAAIRDLIKQHRFDEALRTAHDLIATYPHSPQADVLREQLPRLEQKAGRA